MILVAHDWNPLPPGAVVGFVTTPDRVRLRFARWHPPGGRARGTVVVVQGRAEFIEKYVETAGDLLARGFAVVTFDWRGQGGSDRLLPDPLKGHVGRFRDYRADLEAVLEQIALPDCPGPLYGLGHSMGGHLLLAAAAHGPLPFQRLVAVAPMLGLGRYPLSEERIAQISRTLARMGLTRRSAPGSDRRTIATLPFAGNPLTSDARRFERNADIARQGPHLVIGAPTVGWLAAACRSMARLRRYEIASRITTPTLVVACAADVVVSTPAIERFAGTLKSVGHVLVGGARHELLQERDTAREQFWGAFDAFIPGSA